MKLEISLPQVACMLVNSLFLKLVISAETRTRTEAARPWIEILAAENIPVIFDAENGVFVVSPEALALEREDEIGGKPKPAELEVPADSVKVTVKKSLCLPAEVDARMGAAEKAKAEARDASLAAGPESVLRSQQAESEQAG